MVTIAKIISWCFIFLIFSCAYSAVVFITLGVMGLVRKMKNKRALPKLLGWEDLRRRGG